MNPPRDAHPSDELSLPHVSSLLQRRDIAAFGEALIRYRPLLKELVASTGDPRLKAKLDASDIVQQTYEDALKGFDQLRANSTRPFYNWITTLLFNNVLTVKRRFLRTQKRDIRVERSIADDTAAIKTIFDPFESPEQEAIVEETLQRLANAVDNLPIAVQKVLKWRFEDGMTHREIGDRVDRSEDAVRMLINRSMVSLKSAIDDGESEMLPSG